MILSSVLTIVLASLASTVSAQSDTQGPIVFDSTHNATTIYGTWSSGSKHVLTGPVRCLFFAWHIGFLTFIKGFANPGNMTFNYPKTTGMSYSLCVDLFSSLDVNEVTCFIAQPTVTMRSQDIGSMATVRNAVISSRACT
jgi:hypothetical protein